MKKSFFLKALLVVSAVFCCLGLASCDTGSSGSEQGEPQNHEHTLVEYAEVQSTCDKEGNYRFWECTECGKKYRDNDGITLLSDEDVIMPKTEHKYGEYKVTKTKTCTENGEEERECSACHAIDVRVIESSGHAYEWKKDEFSHYRECSVCKEEDGKAFHDYDTENKCRSCDYRLAYNSELTYAETEDGYAVTGPATITGSLVIPCYYNGKPVTEIAAEAFSESKIESVVLPSTLKRIKSWAFASCNSLSTMHITDVAAWCETLIWYGGLDSLLSYTNDVYVGNELLTDLVVPEGVKNICAYTFYSCKSLKSVVMADSVEKVVSGAFEWCSSLETVTVGANTKEIGRYAFNECSRLVTVKNRSELLIEKGSVENGRIALNAIEVLGKDEESTRETDENGFVFIGDGTKYYLLAYEGKENNVVLPESYRGNSYEIAPYAFSGRKDLYTVRISDGVTAIGKAAFYGCSRLYSVTLGRNVNQISTGAFNTCRNLVEVINLSPLKIERGDYDNGNVSAYALAVSTSESSRSTHIVDGYLFCDADDNNSYLISYYGEKTHLTLPATYRGEEYLLGNYRAYPFYEHPTIESVDIPEGFTKIGPNAFIGCPLLSSVRLPDSLKNIGDAAFGSCSSLHDVSVGGNIVTVGSGVFGSTPVRKASTDESGVVYLPARSSGVFYLLGASTTLSGKYATQSGTRVIADYAFSRCASLTGITISDGTLTIGSCAFSGCDSLLSVDIPFSVNYIGGGAFYHVFSIKTINIVSVVAWKKYTSAHPEGIGCVMDRSELLNSDYYYKK